MFPRKFLVFLDTERLLGVPTAEDDVSSQFFGCHGDGGNQSRVCAVLHLCHAHVLVSHCVLHDGRSKVPKPSKTNFNRKRMYNMRPCLDAN